MFVIHHAKYASKARSISLQIAVEHGRQVVTGISLFRAALLTAYLFLSGIPLEAICRAVIKRPSAKLQLLLEGYAMTPLRLFAVGHASRGKPGGVRDEGKCQPPGYGGDRCDKKPHRGPRLQDPPMGVNEKREAGPQSLQTKHPVSQKNTTKQPKPLSVSAGKGDILKRGKKKEKQKKRKERGKRDWNLKG